MTTSRTGTDRATNSGPRCDRGLTLIELVLVMAVLAVVALVAVPQLSRFMQGRALREESVRFLALTRSARDVAVNEGLASRLWIDPQTGEYGVYTVASGDSGDRRARSYRLGRDLSFEFAADTEEGDGRYYITYWSDGSLDDSSVTLVRIAAGGESAMEIARQYAGAQFALSSGSAREAE